MTFLNSGLEKKVYMEQSESFIVSEKENMICKLKKNIYRLKQAFR